MLKQDNCMVTYNVRSLPSKLSALLAWPCSLFLLTEVRVDGPKQRSLGRVLAGKGCSCVWGVQPPPSPTFSVAPGGVAIIAKSPWSVRPYPLPILDKWRKRSRVVTALATHPTMHNILLVCVYGYSDTHPNRGLNEDLLRDALTSIASLNIAAFVGGDLNVHVAESSVLTLSEAIGVTCVSPVRHTTTKTKTGAPSSSHAIDLMFANYKAKDLVSRARVNYHVHLSDHYPVEVMFVTPKCDFPVVKWPRTVVLPPKKEPNMFSYHHYHITSHISNGSASPRGGCRCPMASRYRPSTR